MNDMTPTTGTALALALPASTELAVMLKTENGLDATLASLKAAAQDKVKGADVNTVKGRELMRSAAYDVSKSKTEIVKRGKELTEQARKEVAAVNAGIKTAEVFLDTLRDQIKAPAVEWDAQEQARKDRIEAMLNAMRHHGMTAANSSADLAAKILEIDAIDIGDEFGDQREQAEMVRETATRDLRNLLAAVEKAEQDARELEELRAEKVRRDAEEAERLSAEQERIASEEAEKARVAAEARAKAEAEEAEKRRAEEAKIALAARATNARAYIEQIGKGFIGGQPQAYGILFYELESKLPALIDELGEHAEELHKLRTETLTSLKAAAEADREIQEAREAEERKAAEAKAAAEAKERAEREKAELEAKHKREVEEAAQRERDRLAAEQKADADAKARREADAAHRSEILNAIATDLNGFISETDAILVAAELMNGSIRHCEVRI